MDILLRVGAAGRVIDFGVAVTSAERAAVLGQRFRVYKRSGYHRPGLRVDRDEYDRRAIYFLATLASNNAGGATLAGSARLILGEAHARFRFPVERALRFELPPEVVGIPTPRREEVSRLVTERPEGIGLGNLLIPLGLIQAIATYSRRREILCGMAGIKRRLFRALVGAGVRMHELPHTGVTYPANGPLSGYFQYPEAVVPVYWLADEIIPSVVEAMARYQGLAD